MAERLMNTWSNISILFILFTIMGKRSFLNHQDPLSVPFLVTGSITGSVHKASEYILNSSG